VLLAKGKARRIQAKVEEDEARPDKTFQEEAGERTKTHVTLARSVNHYHIVTTTLLCWCMEGYS
jgi:hypothetical protein